MGKHFQQMFSKNENMSPEEKATKWFEVAKSTDYEGHDALLPHILHLESVTVAPTKKDPHNCRIVYSFTVPKQLCNMGGNLHGGAVALIFDICTSTAITAISHDGFWDTGHVSRTLNCTYLRPAAEGTKVYVISEVVHAGKRQSLTKGEIRLGTEDGKIAYTCEHGKAAVGSSNL